MSARVDEPTAVGWPTEIVWAASDRWLRRAAELMDASAEALNAINVFPVSDADTGSNLKLTLAGIASAVPELRRQTVDAAAQAAILSAHGNSGAIVAEMVSSVCRRLRLGWLEAPAGGGGRRVAELLSTAAEGARRAVAEPVAGTILSVADAAALAAAEAAATEAPIGSAGASEREAGSALRVAQRAQQAAYEELRRTPEHLEVLASAGVVDAGAQAYCLLLDVLVEVLGGAGAEPVVAAAPAWTAARGAAGGQLAGPVGDYEVMYALRGAEPGDLDALRRELSVIGYSVVIVGDETLAQVHVHLRDAGAAVEAALPRGTVSQIRITALSVQATASVDRSVVAVVPGAGLADTVRSLGGEPLLTLGARATLEQLTATVAGTCGDLVILPNDMETLEVATHVAGGLRASGRRVAVIPTVAQVQGLAALAVHEPTADFESAVVAMSRAAGHARHGAVTVAEAAAMTMAGRCLPGDVLGIVEGDFVEIGHVALEVAWAVVRRLTSSGGDLLTVVTGAGAEHDLGEQLARRVARHAPHLEVEVLHGGQPRYLLLLGLE